MKEGDFALKRKEVTGNPEKFSIAMLIKLKRIVSKRPFITARQIKMNSQVFRYSRQSVIPSLVY